METEEERQARRRERIKEMQREKRRVEMLRKCIGVSIAAMAGLTGCFLGLKGASLINHKSPEETHEQVLAKDNPSKGGDMLSEEAVWTVKHMDDSVILKAGLGGEGRNLAASGEEIPNVGGMTHGMGGAGEDEASDKDWIADIQAPGTMGNDADGQVPGTMGSDADGQMPGTMGSDADGQEPGSMGSDVGEIMGADGIKIGRAHV